MLKSIGDLIPFLEHTKNQILQKLGISDELMTSIQIAESPNPEMGDYGFPLFALAKILRKSPQIIAQEVASQLNEANECSLVECWKAIGPYVNVFLDKACLTHFVLKEASENVRFGSNLTSEKFAKKRWMLEFSSPNTNKPQHLGHVRNNLLGDVCARLLAFTGDDVLRVNLINDRGIHICKSMYAYNTFGENETPESADIKGDHLVGKYYVLFNTKLSEEYNDWLQSDEGLQSFQDWKKTKENANIQDFTKAFEDQYFNFYSKIGADTKQMLRLWEAKDENVRQLWQTMNEWVFNGFDETYKNYKISFDKLYKESETYLLGREIVEEGLKKGVFTELDDGAVACDLGQVGMPDQIKILLRNDGTSVYMTQDLGTALARFNEYEIDEMVYCVGNEQEYHFNVLFKILELIRPELKGHLKHLSYGMVELPDGKMKSREGTVVDADDLLEQTTALAESAIRERWPELDDAERQRRARIIALAGLKFNILDYNPRTTVHFNPKESIELQGRTGPYSLYSYARIQSILKSDAVVEKLADLNLTLETLPLEASKVLKTNLELETVRMLQQWPTVVADAARLFEPNRITEHLFKISKSFSSLYNDPDHRIREVEGERFVALLLICRAVAKTLATGLELLGIEVLEEM